MRIYHVLLSALTLSMGGLVSYAEGLPSLHGTVQQYLLSPHGEPDGVLLSDGTISKFPPHLGIALASQVKPGDPIEAIGFLGMQSPHGRSVQALSIRNTKTGQTVFDRPPINPRPSKHEVAKDAITINGAVTHVLVNQHGDADGLILTGGEQVQLRPHQVQRILELIRGSRTMLTISGYGIRNVFGTVLQAKSLRVDGNTLELEDKPGKPGKRLR